MKEKFAYLFISSFSFISFKFIIEDSIPAAWAGLHVLTLHRRYKHYLFSSPQIKRTDRDLDKDPLKDFKHYNYIYSKSISYELAIFPYLGHE